MYVKEIWEDHITEKTDVFIESKNPDGTITHTPVEGEVMHQGTPMDATRFNNMENGILNNDLMAAEFFRMFLMVNRELAYLKGVTGTLTLTNIQNYPFNESQKTVAIPMRDTLDYTVETEVMEADGGFTGDIIISDKLLNGFKIQFTGSAESVAVKYTIRGGVFQ
jgi:hypothetical protein